MQGKNQKGKPPLGGGPSGPFLWYVVAGVLLVMLLNVFFVQRAEVVPLDFSGFKQKIEDGEVKRVELTPKAYYGYSLTKEEAQQLLKDKTIGKSPNPAPKEYKLGLLQGKVDILGRVARRLLEAEVLDKAEFGNVSDSTSCL